MLKLNDYEKTPGVLNKIYLLSKLNDYKNDPRGVYNKNKFLYNLTILKRVPGVYGKNKFIHNLMILKNHIV